MNTAAAEPAPSLAEQLENILLSKLAANKLVLPVMPEAATTVLNLMRNPNVGTRDLVPALERDPLLCAQVLRAANAASHGLATVQTTDQALQRIGSARVRSLVVAWCARRVFVSREPRVRALLQANWERTLMTAILARDLASLAGSNGSEAAFLAGILQDVGRPVVAAFLLELERVAEGRGQPSLTVEQFDRTIGVVARPVALAIVEQWRLPDTVVATVRGAGEYDPVDRQAIANFVKFAAAYVAVATARPGESRDDESALVMVGRSLLDVADDMLARLSGDLKQRAGAMMEGTDVSH